MPKALATQFSFGDTIVEFLIDEQGDFWVPVHQIGELFDLPEGHVFRNYESYVREDFPCIKFEVPGTSDTVSCMSLEQFDGLSLVLASQGVDAAWEFCSNIFGLALYELCVESRSKITPVELEKCFPGFIAKRIEAARIKREIRSKSSVTVLQEPESENTCSKKSVRGKVYLIGNLEYGFVKIGFSRKISTRVKALQTNCPFPITLLATIPGSIDSERLLHKKFAEARTSGEWFSINEGNKKLFMDAFHINNL